jgi:hypothetical protein
MFLKAGNQCLNIVHIKFISQKFNVPILRPLTCWDCGFECRRGHECVVSRKYWVLYR